ncbi:MAG TPA: S9 family peptidase [Chryseolinea sp.]|nr:S9 family peptidase [Chryseolinea sp.]
MKKIFIAIPLVTFAIAAFCQVPLKPSDVNKVKYVDDPEVSPDGKWVAYILSEADTAEDKYDEDIWMTATDGSGSVQLTYSEEDETQPKWSPDNKWISFLSGRHKAKEKTQFWLMDRRGGEAKQVTELKVSISDYEWSPDSKKVLFTIKDQEVRPDSLKDHPAKPYVIDRYQFKADITGYLEHKYSHLYLFDLETKKLDTLTKGNYNHSDAAWSPDGKYIAYTSNRTDDPDRNTNSDIFIIEAKPKAKPRQLTTWADFDRNPEWSPDGKSIAYLRSISPEWDAYDEPHLAVVSINGGEPRILTKDLDRPVTNPKWSKDGSTILALIEDDRQRYVMSFDVASGKYIKVSEGDRSVTIVRPLDQNKSVVLMSETKKLPEIYVLENKSFKNLTNHNDKFLKSMSFAAHEGFTFKDRDGIEVGGILYWPAGKAKTEKLPLVLWIHGGPVAQDEYEFDMTIQMIAARGYAVAAINYRGSNGRGYPFARAIFGDWGNKEVVDLIDGVNYLIKKGAVDANRLGIGGWSYRGILTDYVTATDSRFKAAASGAGSALQITMYGTDQYVQQYEMELGVPWKNMDKWMKLSYPFMNIEKIKTPTLYMVGEMDYNVPAAGSEQMYQALRSLGVPTQLVIYPKQNHGLTVPSYWKDRYQRYADWFGKYLK